MQNLGYSKPLYILPFDHRANFAKDLFGLSSVANLDANQRHLIKEFKMLIYKGFKKAIDLGIPTDFAALLCDEEFGSEVLLDAKHNGFMTILTIEKSGEKEFKFQYEDFKSHIQNFRPNFTKVLIRYNPADLPALKLRQKENLKILSDYSHEDNFKFLLELLVIPTKNQLLEVSNDFGEYDRKLRPDLTTEVIKDLQNFGIEPDVWKLEGFDTEFEYAEIVKAIKSNGRENVGLVILGRGANEEKVDEWLRVGSRIRGVIGFAIGRTVFWDLIKKFNKGEIGKAEVMDTVAANFFEFYKMFTLANH